MSFIKILSPEEANPKLKAAFEEIIEWRNGRLPPVLQCMSLNPDAMLAVKNISAVLGFGGSTLGERREEMIATAVSQMNDCDY